MKIKLKINSTGLRKKLSIVRVFIVWLMIEKIINLKALILIFFFNDRKH